MIEFHTGISKQKQTPSLGRYVFIMFWTSPAIPSLWISIVSKTVFNFLWTFVWQRNIFACLGQAEFYRFAWISRCSPKSLWLTWESCQCFRLQIVIVRFVCSFKAYIKLKLIFVGMIKCVWYLGGVGGVSSLWVMLAVLWGFLWNVAAAQQVT